MREALAHAGLWGFGSIGFLLIFGSFYRRNPLGEQILILAGIGIVVAGAVFCKEWYEMEKRKRLRAERLESRRPTDDHI